jgi:malonyl-CoA O-methyltransferase
MKTLQYFKTSKIIENWDKEAENWDKHLRDPNHYVNWENGYSRFLKFLDKEMPLANKNKPGVALDSGCGTGVISDVLNKKGYKTVGVDISPRMLKFAHKNGKERQYVLANSLDIPYADNYFNVICSRGVLISHVGKKYASLFLKEHHRVLKSGGLFMFDFITKFKESEVKKRKEKAYFSFNNISGILKSYGFEVLKRSGEDINRVNAILCKKI